MQVCVCVWLRSYLTKRWMRKSWVLLEFSCLADATICITAQCVTVLVQELATVKSVLTTDTKKKSLLSEKWSFMEANSYILTSLFNYESVLQWTYIQVDFERQFHWLYFYIEQLLLSIPDWNQEKNPCLFHLHLKVKSATWSFFVSLLFFILSALPHLVKQPWFSTSSFELICISLVRLCDSGSHLSLTTRTVLFGDGEVFHGLC